MNTITYEFEELQLVPNYECYVWGEADIVYEIEPADAYTGYRGGFSYAVVGITLYADKKDQPGLDLDANSELFTLVDAALHKDPHEMLIVNEIEKTQCEKEMGWKY